MTAHNRYLEGDQETFLGDVHSYTVIEAGDLCFIFETDGDRGAGLASDGYVFPFSDARAATGGTAIQETIYSSFCGVAMESSPSGVTEKITIASSGIFRYPLKVTGGVTVGALICSPSPAAGPAAGASDQTVYHADDTTAYLGYCVKSESGASFVDFQIRTKFTGFAS